MGFAGPLADRIAITELNNAYGHAASCGDLDLMRPLWMPDACWTHPYFGEQQGIEPIIDVIRAAFEAHPLIVFTCQVGSLEIDGDRAAGTIWVSELVCRADGDRRQVTGRYDDRYVRVDGQWRFARREYRILDLAAVALAAV